MAEKRTERRRVTVIVIRGNMMEEGRAERVFQLEIVMRLVKLCVPKAELLSDEACILMELPTDEEGDAEWLSKEVMNRVYIDGVRSTQHAQEKAERLYAICKEKGGEGRVGLGIIRKYLNDFFMMPKGASIFVR